MRKLLVSVVVLILLATAVPVFGTGRAGFSADIASVQDIFLGKGSFQIGMDLRMMVSDEFQVRISIAYTMDRTSFMIESGVSLVYYPWHTGPFMGLSVFQFGFSHGSGNLENVVSLNEVMLGWSFEFGPGLFVEPGIVIRDPSGTFADEYSRLKGEFPCYTTFRGRLAFGWYFWR